MDLQRAILCGHARDQLADRQLTEAQIRAVLDRPEEVLPVRPGRIVAQSLHPFDDPPKSYLIRVVVDIDRDPPEVVTAYRTSNIDRYRSRP